MTPRARFPVQRDDLLRDFHDRYTLFASLTVGTSGCMNNKYTKPADPGTSCLPSWKTATRLKKMCKQVSKTTGLTEEESF